MHRTASLVFTRITTTPSSSSTVMVLNYFNSTNHPQRFLHRCLALTAACAANCRVRISFVATGAELQEFRRGKEQEQRQQLSQESEATAAAARRESSPRVTLWLLRRRRAGQEDRRHRGQSGFGHGEVCWKPRLEVYCRFYRIHSYKL